MAAPSVTAAQVSSYLNTNSARLIEIEPYDAGGGTIAEIRDAVNAANVGVRASLVGDGGQVLPPHDATIVAEVAKLGPADVAPYLETNLARVLTVPAAAELHHQPRRDHHGDEEGEHHSRAGIGGNRAHVRAHHAADKQHRQQGRHHG